MKFAVGNIEEVTWFSNRFNDVWCAEKKHIPETIRKLEKAGRLDAFLLDHSKTSEDGEQYVDMDAVFEELRHEPEMVVRTYIEGGS